MTLSIRLSHTTLMTHSIRLSHTTLIKFIQKRQLPGNLQLLLFIVHKIAVSNPWTGNLHIICASVFSSTIIITYISLQTPIPVAALSKAWVCRRSLAGIVGSNPAWGMDICLLSVLCVVRYRPLHRAGHSSRGVLPSVACLSVIVDPWQRWGHGPLGGGLLGYVKKLLNPRPIPSTFFFFPFL